LLDILAKARIHCFKTRWMTSFAVAKRLAGMPVQSFRIIEHNFA